MRQFAFLSPLSIVSMVITWESRQGLGKHFVLSTGKKYSRKAWLCIGNRDITGMMLKKVFDIIQSPSLCPRGFLTYSKTNTFLSNIEMVVCKCFRILKICRLVKISAIMDNSNTNSLFVDCIDCMVFYAVFNSISVISRWLVHISMLSWGSISQ